MARPAHADSDKTKRRILESATHLFAEHGMAGVSIRDVAGRAKVNPAMIHHYFADKEHLYERCVDEVLQELAAMKELLRRELVLRTPMEDLFEHAVRTAFRFAREHRTAVRLLIRDAVSTGSVTPFGKSMLLDMLDIVTMAFVTRFGREVNQLRLPIQSIVFLVARYAAQDDRELGEICEVKGDEKYRMVEEHLVRVARAMFPLESKFGRLS